MHKEEVVDLMNYILSNYPQTFKVDTAMVNAWFNELQQYDIADVKSSLAPLMKNQYPPKLMDITHGLRKIYEKTDWSKAETLCQICHKPVAVKDYDNHYDRCLSVNYFIREIKKWFNKELTRKELFEMPMKEFEERYNKLLKYIQEHTKDEHERERIGFIFNPPSKERAKAFLGG